MSNAPEQLPGETNKKTPIVLYILLGICASGSAGPCRGAGRAVGLGYMGFSRRANTSR